MKINSTAPLFNLTINSTNSPIGILDSNALSVGGTVTISSGGTLNANNLGLSVKGDWTNSGTFTPGTQTTTFNGTGAQTITTGGSGAGKQFSSVTISKSSGTATLAGNLGVAADLSVSAGTFDLSNFTADRASAGGTLTLANSTTLKIGGTNTLPANYSTHSIDAGSTIQYTGTTQTVATLNSSQNYGTLTITGSGTKTLAGNIGVASALTLSAGTFDIGTSTITPVGLPLMTLTNGTTLKIGGANNFPAFGAQTIGPSSTQDFNRDGDQTIPGQPFGNLTLSGTTAAQNKNPAAGVTVQGSFSVGSNVTFAGGAATHQFFGGVSNSGTITSSGSLTDGGSWANSGTFTPSGSSTVTFNGTGNTQTISGSTIFKNLTINHSGAGSVTAAGSTLAVTGTLEVQSGTFTSATQYNNVQIDSGATLALSGDISVSGNWTNNNGLQGSGLTANSFKVTFNGAANQTIGGTTSTTFAGLEIANTGSASNNIVSLYGTDGASTPVVSSLTVTSGIFDQGTGAASCDFRTTGSSTVATVASGAIWQNLGTGDVKLSGDLSNAGTIVFNANGTACGDTPSNDDILIRSVDSSGTVVTTQRTWSGTGTFSMTDVNVKDQKVPGGVTAPIFILVNSGTNAGNNTGWTFVDQCTSGTYTWIGGTAGAATDWTVGTNWNPTRATPANGDILYFDGTSTPSPTVTNVPTQIITALRLINNVNGVTLSAGADGNRLTISGSTGTDFSVPSGCVLTLSGSNALKVQVSGANQGSVGGQVIMQGGAHQLIGAAGNAITFSNGSTFTTTTGHSGMPFGSGGGGANGADSSIAFQSGSAANFGGSTGDPFGNSANPVTIFASGSTQTFFTSTALSYGGRSYGNLLLDGSQTYDGGSTSSALTVQNSFTLQDGSTFKLSSAADLNLLGNFIDNSTSSSAFNANSRAVNFNGGNTTQTITKASGAETFYDLTISETSGGKVRLLSAVTINGQLNLSTAASVLELNGKTLTLGGTITGTGNLKGDASATLAMTGTGALGTLNFLSSFQTLSSLTMNRTSSGSAIFGNNMSVGSVTLSNGVVNMGSFTLSITGAVTRTSGWIIGNEQRAFTCGTGGCPITFDVGTANGYSPVSESLTVSQAGSYTQTVKAVQGQHPNIHGVSPNALQRYWTLNAPSGPSSASADITFTYLASDVVGTASSYVFFRNSSGAWSQQSPASPPSTTSATINGVGTFSDWTLAEAGAITPGTISFISAPYSDSETNTNHDFVITVRRSGGVDGAVSINYAVTDGTATIADNDYSVSPASGTFNWADNDTADKTITINVKGDQKFESDETVNLTLSSATGGATIGTPNPTALTITNDDTCAPPPLNLRAWWKGENDANDSAGPNNGQMLNGATFAAGKVGQAMSFNGSFSYMKANYNPSLLASGQFSLDLWANFNSVPRTGNASDNMRLVENIQNYQLTWRADTQVMEFDIADACDGQYHLGFTVPLPSLAAGVWHHYAVTAVDGGSGGPTFHFYFDGVEQTITAISSSGHSGCGWYAFGGDEFHLGLSPNTFPVLAYNGLLDEIEIFNRALTGAEVTSIVNGDTAGKCSASTVSVAVAPASVPEDQANNLVYTFTRDGDISVPVTVNFNVGGDAQFSTDFTQSGAATFTATNGTVTFAAGNSTTTITVDPTVDGTVESNETVTLTLTSGTGYYIGSPNAATGTILNDDSQPDLVLNKTDSVDPATEGNLLTYSLAIQNNGGNATNVVITDTLPANVTFVTASAGCTNSSGTVTCSVGSVPFQTSATRTITVIPTHAAALAGSISNTATVTETETDANTADNTDAETTTVVSPTCTAQPSGMTNWWMADSNAKDFIGGQNGTLTNGATIAPGKVGNAFSFNGVNQYVAISNSDVLPGNFSMDAWIYPTTVANDAWIFSKELANPINTPVGFYVEAGGKVVAGTRGSSGNTQYRTNDVAIVPNQWQHIVVTYNGGAGQGTGQSFKIYVNGINYPSSPTGQFSDQSGGTLGTPYSNGNAKIGSHYNGTSGFFPGQIDELEIFNRILSPAEVVALFDSGTAGKCVTNLSVQKTDSADPIAIGNDLTYTITVAYRGSSPGANIVATDTLPANVAFVNASAGCTNVSGTVTCNIGTLNNAETSVKTITVTPAASTYGTTLSNIVAVTSDAVETDTSDNSWTETTDVGCIAKPTGMTAWWRANNTAADIIGEQNGTLANGATYAAGKVNQAFSLNGTNQFVAISNMANAAANFSIDAWINPTSVGSDAWIFSQELPATNTPLGIYVEAGGKLVGWTRVSGGNSQYRTNNVAIVPNQWQHVVATYNGSAGTNSGQSWKFYVNGVFFPSATTGQFNDQGGASISGNGNAKIGSHYSGSSGFFPGLIDEVEVFNRILTQADVTRLNNADTLGKCALTDLSLSKSDAPDPVAEANNLVYTLTAHNGGADNASGVTITDTLPANVSYVTASAGCSNSSGTVTCTVGSLANGADAVRTITVTPTHAAAGTTLTNNASVTGAESDKDTSNNSASASTSVAATPTVSVAVSPAARDEDSGLSMVYTFTRTVTVGTVTVNFSVGGSADFGTDYNQSGAASFTATSGTVTFADGSSTASVSVTPIADTDFEPDETVVLTVTSGTAYNVATSPNDSATGTIKNDDTQAETSVAVSSGNLVITDINGGSSDDTLTITKNGLNIRISDPNNRLSAGAGATQIDLHTVEVPISSVSGNIQVNTLAGNDTLTLDFANGNFMPAGGLSYAGGDPTSGPGDKLIINGGSQGTVTYTYTNAHDGTVAMSAFGTVIFTGLEPLTNTGDSTDTIFNLPSGPNAVTLADDGTSNTLSRLSGATIETTDFANPSNSLKINRGDASDTIAVNALPDFNASLTIGSAGSEFSTITFGGAVTLAANKNLAGNASSTISFSGSSSDIATSGTGTVTLTTARNITMASGSSIGVVNGDLTLNANQQVSATSGNFRGILLTNAALTTTGTGKIGLNGKGGADATTANHMGIQITSGSSVSSTQATAGAGTITLNGSGAAGTQDNRGVEVALDTTIVRSVIGDISITGTGGAGGLNNFGVSLLNGATVSSTGAAKITIDGTGGSGTQSNTGARVSGENTRLTSAGGNISITGHGGSGTADSHHGVSIAFGALVSATGGAKIIVDGTGGTGTSNSAGVIVSRFGPTNLVATKVTSDSGDIQFTGHGGTGSGIGQIGWNIDSKATVVATGAAGITINGTGGTGTTDNYGVGFDSGGEVGTGISAVNGNINITGVSVNTTGADEDGVRLEDSGGAQAVSVTTTGTGAVTITGTAGDADPTSSGINIVDDCTITMTGASNSFIADTMDFGASNVSINANANALTLRQKTNTQAINLGGADSATQLGLTDTELDLITCGTLNLGNSNSGAITVGADITRGASTAMALTSGGDVVISGGQINTGGGTLLLHPGTSPAAAKPTKSAVDVTASTLSFASGLAIVINGTTVDTQYTQLNVAGAVDLTGVDLKLSGTYTPVNGDTFKIVNNDGSADAITGTFNGLAEGASIPNFLGSSLSATITYTGGDGNDVVLTVVGTPEIDLKGNGASIVDGDTTPDAADATDFGTASIGNSVTHSFTILNTGTAPLTLSGTPKVQVSGTNAADFVVTAQPSSPVAASSNTTFAVQFTPSASGVRTATISIANDDTNENPYDFKIQGTGADPACATPPSGMVAWWPGDGNPDDVKGPTLEHGTLVGGATFAAGKVDRAFSLDGTDDYVEVPDSAAVDIAGAISIDAWVKPNVAANQIILSKYDTAQAPEKVSYILQITATGKVLWHVYGGTDFRGVETADGLVATGTFTHIAATFNPSDQTMKIYVNGVDAGATLIAGSASIAALNNTDVPLRLGVAKSGSINNFVGFFNGVLDEVELFNAAITASDVAAIYNASYLGKCRTCATPPTGMVSWWDGSGTGSTANDIAGSSPGTLQNGATFTAGKVGQAFSFNDNNDQVLVAHDASQNTGTQITLDAWIRPTSVGALNANPSIINKRTAGNVEGYTFEINNAGTGLYFEITTSGGVFATTAANALTLNTWQHVAATYDGTTLRIFVNGIQASSNSGTGSINAVTADLVIGRNIALGNSFPGQIDEVELLNRALNATEIAALADAGNAGKCAPAPEIDVKGNAQAVTDGSTSPSTTNDTDFGNVNVGSNSAHTFTIYNLGSSKLEITGITKLGGNAGDFTLGSLTPSSPILSGGSATFTVTFAPSASGLRSTTIHIANSDSNEGDYDFAIQGTGVCTCAPEIAVEQPAGTDLTSGSPTPINFGSSDSGVATAAKTFTIKNTGTGALTITGVTSDSAEFAVDTTGMSTTVNPNNSTTFKVTFTPAAPGPRNSAIHIANNDSDESSFNLNVTGTGNCPTGFVVNSTGDGNDANTGDGICNDGNGKCTLRAAISEANSLNSSCGALTVTFNIPANDPGHVYYKDDGVENNVTNDAAHVAFTTLADDTAMGDIDQDYPHSWWRIKPNDLLPAITVPLTVNGYSQGASTQQAASQNTRHLNEGDDAILRIELDGEAVVQGTGNGLDLEANDGCTIRGLVINHFDTDIYIEDNGQDTIAGNFLGLDVSGTLTDGTSGTGVFVDSGEGSLIGGDLPADRNVISGHGGEGGAGIWIATSFTTVEGNYVGTDRNGVVARANTFGVIVQFGSDNTIGCEVLDGDNLISGNLDSGVRLAGAFGTFVQGNYIGTDKTGQTAIPNGDGVTVFGGQSNYIGLVGFGNVISGNSGEGVELTNSTSGNYVQSNLIGVAADGSTPLGNGANGVEVYTGSSDNVIGVAPNLRRTLQSGKRQSAPNKVAARSPGVLRTDAATGANVIANNTEDGVRITSSGDVNNRVSQNSIYSNGGLGINLGTDGVTPNDSGDGDTGPNEKQNFPTILTVTTGASGVVHFSLDTCDSCEVGPYMIEFFASAQCDGSGNGEGKTYLGSKEVPGSGTFDSDAMAINSGDIITATATDSSGNTSEFSACKSTATPTATNGTVSGQVVDMTGRPIEGAAVRMSGTQNRLTITDALGNYHFDNVETNGVYVVTPSRANFSFIPLQRSFSQLGAHTEATFTGAANGGTLNPLDTTEYFVRQQYLDFLGREPDESGFNFWVNNIESCGNDAGCREVKRIDTSAAFFLSIEFQQTGYLVYRTYQAAYDDLPNAPVPIRLGEFKPDSQQISNGVVVLQDGWQKKIEENKLAFFAEFVKRSRFTLAFPATMTPTEFVDRLFANAHVPLTDSDHTAAIAEFGAAADSSDNAARARALRRVAENSTLTRQQFNQAFVLMEYFGYLRRDPNSGQDIDFAGYNFWLDKLNRFNGNFQNAEMVKAFLTSIEYRGRFPR